MVRHCHAIALCRNTEAGKESGRFLEKAAQKLLVTLGLTH
jgi:hypothetical protein